MEQINLLPYLLSAFPENFPSLRDWMQGIWRSGQFIQTTELLHNLSARILADVGYQVREERGVQSPAETLTAGKGACRDMATLFIEACRYCGLAARFVSGYLLSEAAVVDYGSTHAWAEIYLPGTGWRGFDCTSGQWVSGDHIAVAVHRHPEAVPPISGGFSGSGSARSTMSVDVQVGVMAD
jgi:transglutaminase-like putative cysteine protease